VFFGVRAHDDQIGLVFLRAGDDFLMGQGPGPNRVFMSHVI